MAILSEAMLSGSFGRATQGEGPNLPYWYQIPRIPHRLSLTQKAKLRFLKTQQSKPAARGQAGQQALSDGQLSHYSGWERSRPGIHWLRVFQTNRQCSPLDTELRPCGDTAGPELNHTQSSDLRLQGADVYGGRLKQCSPITHFKHW